MPAATGRDDILSLTKIRNCTPASIPPAGQNDFSNPTQIAVIGSIELEMCMKMLKNWTEKLGAKFPSLLHLASL